VNWRTVLLGLMAFLIALVVVLPASWIGALLPPIVQCEGWRGTLWRGRCRQLTVRPPGVPPVTLETAGWTLHPLPLLGARLSAEVVLTDARGDAAGHVELTRKGALLLREVSVRALLDSKLPTAMPAGWSARVEVSALDLQWQANQLTQLQGDLRFLDLRDERGRELGNYHVNFPATDTPPFKGQLNDEGGPFELQGAIELTMDRNWSLQGTVRPRAGADPSLTRYLQLLGGADPAGRYPLSATGSFN
jgi:hypothetical protein